MREHTRRWRVGEWLSGALVYSLQSFFIYNIKYLIKASQNDLTKFCSFFRASRIAKPRPPRPKPPEGGPPPVAIL